MHARDHIGGTCKPIPGHAAFQSFYLEFEEYLGGYNFGGGNCQLDFLNMQLDGREGEARQATAAGPRANSFDLGGGSCRAETDSTAISVQPS